MQYTHINQNLSTEISRIEKGNIEYKTWKLTEFSTNLLGIRPYKYQHLLFKHFLNPNIRRIIVCKSRQIGISTAIEIMALYSAYYNLFPTGVFHNTKIGIVSKSDKQAKKVLLDIKKMMESADLNFDAQEDKPFINAVNKDRIVPQNVYELNFKNKAMIKCFPPTDAIRGEALDVVFVDEGAFIENGDEIFHDSIEPTTSKTQGKIIISSTPNGQKGYFFEIFDPYDRFKKHEYLRFWFHWKQCEDMIQKKIISQNEKIAKETGNLKHFEQEYNAKFTVDEEAFFEDSDINNAIDKTISQEYTWKLTPCALAIDYGQTKSATTLTVKTIYKNKIVTLFQYAAFNFDENLLMDKGFEHSVPNMMDRYDIKWIEVDDCPQGYRTNIQLEKEGYPVKRFDFKGGEKNKAFYSYRTALKKGLISYPEIRELIIEMKSLMEIRMKITTQITKPVNGTDDRIDGEVMATIPFLDEEGDFGVVAIDYKPTSEELKKRYEGRAFDEQWDQLSNSSLDYSKLIKNEVKE